MPRHRYNEARSFIASGLQDVSLSRSTFTWGVPVPWNPEHVFYVWFEALLNYYTALSYAKPGEDLTDRFWPAQYHIIGKDILKFHTVFWPAMLLAAGLPLPEHVFVHGFLLIGQDKTGKSRRQRDRPVQDHRRVRADALRYYSCATSPSARTGRCLEAGFRGRLRVRARQRLRQPRQPHDRDGPPLPRRRRAVLRARSRARGRDRPDRARGQGAARPRRPDRARSR